ncbi:hypothetical protein JCM8097_006559 [Rhodosporidiobolus ruineniae]
MPHLADPPPPPLPSALKHAQRAPAAPLPLVPHPSRTIDLSLSDEDDDDDDQLNDSLEVLPRRWMPSPAGHGVGASGSGAGGAGSGKNKGKDKGKAKQHDEVLVLTDEDWETAAAQFFDDAGDLVMDRLDAGAVVEAPQAGPSRSNSNSSSSSASASASASAARVPSPPAPAPPVEVDPLDASVSTVCSILPDVLPSYVRDLLQLPMYGPGNVELVIEALFEAEGKYPKLGEEEEKAVGGVEGKGKGKGKEKEVEKTQEERDEETMRKAKMWVEKGDRQAGGKNYEEAALAQLYLDFPTIQQNNLKKLFASSSSFYTPAYLAAQKAVNQTNEERGYKLMAGSSRARPAKGKGKTDEEFERERKWVVEELSAYKSAQRRADAKEKKLQEEIDSGAYFECGCCFGETALSQMVSCLEGCSFCQDCGRMNAETQIGMRKYILPCMSTSGCPSVFSEREAERFLSRTTLAALHKIKQEKDLHAAEIEGLEQCPFCPFACIIENPDERLFVCQRDGCKVTSCRQCKKKDHLPKTCKEVDDDAVVNSVHRIEEAMSAALIRTCPKEGCGEPYVKENDSCNKITCSSCRTLSCYLCNKIIKDYSHFSNAGSNAPNGGDPTSKCPLWDDTDARNFQEVEAARIAAEAAARAENPGVSDENLAKLAMDQPKAAPHRIAHLAAPRVEAYEALVRAGAADALLGGGGAAAGLGPRGRAQAYAAPPPPPLPRFDYAMRNAQARAEAPPPGAWAPRMPDAAAAAPVVPPPPPPAPLLRGRGLAALGRQRYPGVPPPAGADAAAAAALEAADAARRKLVDEQYRAALERKRVRDQAAQQAVEAAARQRAEQRRRRDEEDARREERRRRTSGGRQ